MVEQAEKIDLFPATAEGTIDLNSKTDIPKDEKTVQIDVQKADYALGRHSPGQAELAADFWSGYEDRVREQAALAESLDRREHYNRVATDIFREAAQQGRELTDLERSFILDQPYDASEKTALEERWANRTVDEVFEKEKSEGMKEEAVAPAKRVLSYQQIAQKNLQKLKERYDDTSWAAWGWDFAKSLIPGETWYQIRNRIPDVGADALLTGENLAQQIRGLYLAETPEEFQEALEKATNEIAESNILDAMQFAQAAVEYSTSDEVLDNLFAGLDALDIATLGGSAVLGVAAKAAKGTKVGRAAKKIQDTLRAASRPDMSEADRRVLAGDPEGAAVVDVRNKLKENILETPLGDARVGSSIETSANNPAKETFSLADPENYLRNPGSLTKEYQRRLIEQLQEVGQILKSSVTDVGHIVRTDEASFLKGVELAKREFLRVNYRLEDGIVDIRPVREQAEVFAGHDRVEFLIGNKDAAAFKSPENADFWARSIYKLPKGGYEIESVGGSYFIKMEKSVREDSLEVLETRLNTENKAPVNWTNTYLKWFANPDRIRSDMATASAKQATYGSQRVLRILAEAAESIGSLGKNERERLATIMNEARFKKRVVLDPNGEEVTVSGKFYDTVGEFEQAYLNRGFSLPTLKETEAYFTFRQIMDFDHAFRNASVRRDMQRLGVNQKSVGWIHRGPDGKKQYKQSEFFNGRLVDSLPSDANQGFTFGYYNGDTGKSKFFTSHALYGQGGFAIRKEIDELLAKDYKVIQVYDPLDATVQKFVNSGGEPVQYLIVRDLKEKPLATLQVPYAEGGHWITPQAGAYLKQPNVRDTKFQRKIYTGDTSVHWFGSLKDGAKFQEAYETARKMMLENDPRLDEFVARNLPYADGAAFRALFRTLDNPEGFDPNMPFVLVESGKKADSVIDLKSLVGREFVDMSKDEHSLASRVHGTFTQERGERLTSVKTVGTEQNPTFKLTGAPVMDAMDALSRSMSELARSRFYDDYKNQVLENYVTDFKDVIGKTTEEFLADPMEFIRNPVWRDGADPRRLASAKQNRRALLYLLGHDTLDMGVIKWARQKTLDSIYKGGDSKILDSWKWTKDADPAVVARSAVFHAKLGLFNVLQFFLQAQSVIHVFGVDGSPVRAAQANFLYWGMRMRGLAAKDSKAQGFISKGLAKALGVDRKIVDEMYEAWKNSGMGDIGGAYARLDDHLNPKEFWKGGTVKQGLDAGSFFFREGNRVHLGVAFATAFLRWRQMNPLKKLTSEELRKIVDRADIYAVNMSRASNNDIIASSIASVPAQFFTYHKNVAEQFTGKRLTWPEKMRLFGVYSLFYGVPVAAGASGVQSLLWPVHDSIRQYIDEQGLDYDSNAVTKLLVDGLGSMLVEYATGEKYDVGGRYGPGNMTWVRDLMDGELLEVFGGASGSSLGDMIARVEPFYHYIASVFTPGSEEFPITKEDVLDIAKEISSINNFARVYAAMNAGMFMTKAGSPLKKIDADIGDAIAIAMGLTPQDVSDTYLRIRSNKQAAEAKAEISKEARKWFLRALKASADGDVEEARKFYGRAHYLMEVFGGFTSLEMANVYRASVKDTVPLFEKISREFMLKDPEKRRDQYFREMLKDR